MERLPASPGQQSPAAPFVHQPELRALMVFPTLPPGHMTFLVPDDRFAPHLRPGKFAVVDLSDRQPERGELFLISYISPRDPSGFAYHLCQMHSRPMFLRPDGMLSRESSPGAIPETVWTAAHWLPPSEPAEYARLVRERRLGSCEGPFSTEHVAEKLVGRVVGVWGPKAG